MVRHTFKILQHLLQDFKSVSDHFGTLCIKGLTYVAIARMNWIWHICSAYCDSYVSGDWILPLSQRPFSPLETALLSHVSHMSPLWFIDGCDSQSCAIAWRTHSTIASTCAVYDLIFLKTLKTINKTYQKQLSCRTP